MFDRGYLNQVVAQIRSYKLKIQNESESTKILKIATKNNNSINNNNYESDNKESQNSKHTKYDEDESESILDNIPNEILFHLIKVGSISIDDYQNLMITNRNFCKLLNSPFAKRVIINECKSAFDLLDTPKNIIRYLNLTKKIIMLGKSYEVFKGSFIYFKKDNEFGVLVLHEIYGDHGEPELFMGLANEFTSYRDDSRSDTDDENQGISLTLSSYFMTKIERGEIHDDYIFKPKAYYPDDPESGYESPVKEKDHNYYIEYEKEVYSHYKEFFSINKKYDLFTGFLENLLNMGYEFGNLLIQNNEITESIPATSKWIPKWFISRWLPYREAIHKLIYPIVMEITKSRSVVIFSKETNLMNTSYLLHPSYQKYQMEINQ